MRFLTEKCFYICVISILAFLALLLPLVIIGAQRKPPARYVFIGFSKNFTDWSKYDHIIWGTPPELRPFEHLFRPHDNRVNPRHQLNPDDSWYSVEKLGTTPGNKSVYVVKLQKPSTGDKPFVLLAGGLRTGDKNAILATLRLMKNTKSSKILDIFDLHFIPILDPDADAPPMGASNTSENGWSIFKQYFNQNKKLFKAVFLLKTPQKSRQGKRITLPQTFVKKAPQRYSLFKNVVNSSEIGNLFGVFSSNNSGGIDEWLVRQTLPTPVLVVNVEMDFRPNLALNNALFLESVTKHLYTLLELLRLNKNLTNS